MTPKADIRDILARGPMSAAQIRAVALCAVLNMVDGFDILVAAFTGPAIARDWLLSPTQLGLFFSSGLAGMTLGALGLSPLADRIGRRRAVLMWLCLITVGMSFSAAARSLWYVVAARLITGAGVGAMMPAINTAVAEYSNRSRHDLAVCLQGMGFPLGATLGAFAVYLVVDLNWRWVFMAGALMSLILIVPVSLWMPESVEFLVERRPRHALKRLNAILNRFGIATIETLPRARSSTSAGAHVTLIWGQLKFNTLLICSSFFLLMFTFYFLSNWTPKLLADFASSSSLVVSGAALMNLGGLIGDLVFAVLMTRWSARSIGPIFMGLCFVTTIVLAHVPLRVDALSLVALVLGFLLFGAMSSLYAIVPTLYPATIRTTGTGIALGLGRIGAAVGPYVGGALISLAWQRMTLLLVMASPLLVCAALTLAIAKSEGVAGKASMGHAT